jgi:antitoxin HicB
MKGKKQLDAYPFNVRPLSAEDGGGYLIEYPDLPGVISDGATPDEAIRNGRDALEAALRTLKEFGDPIPQPGAAPASGQWRQRVPKSLHARLVQQARQEGVSLNTLVTSMIAEGLGKRNIRLRER